MICLGIEASGRAVSVAIMREDALEYEVFLQAGLTHSETLQGLIGQGLNAMGLTVKDLGLVGVCAGPGSFTGLRIGLAAAKGLCFAYDTKAVGVSSLEVLAENICAEGDILSVTDARRGEVYYALFHRTKGVIERITEDATAPITKLCEILAPHFNGQLYLVGDAAALCYEAFASNVQVSAVMPSDTLRYPRAAGVCTVAMRTAANDGATSAQELTPCYHRLAQAERERQEREKNIEG